MTEPSIDEFSARLLEEAKRFLELAKDAEGDARGAYLHAALLLSFCSLEAHVNAVAEEFSVAKGLETVEKSILLEQDYKLRAGEFVLEGQKIYRLLDRIEFIIRRFGGSKVDTSADWWLGLKGATSLRNKLVHPKSSTEIKYRDTEKAIESIIATIDQVYLSVYKTGFPAAKRGLHSKLHF